MKSWAESLKSKYIFLSHALEDSTPSYGNKDSMQIQKISDMKLSAISNHTTIKMSMHLGTHIDFPMHFFDDSAGADTFGADFFVFCKPLVVEVVAQTKVIYRELIDKLNTITDMGYDILLVRTGEEANRKNKDYMLSNVGFAPQLADFLREKFPSVRVMGFDSISVSSFTDRLIGREAHKAFLNPKTPILLLEDMSFAGLGNQKLQKVIVAPVRVVGADGAPCTVFGEVS